MVRLEEVQDEAFATSAQDDAEWDTDSDSDISSIASDASDADIASESLLDRLTALSDMIPPSSRRKLSAAYATSSSWAGWALSLAGRGAWAVSVSGLLLITPFALASLEDQQLAMEERQMEMQRGANEIVAPGASTASALAGQGRPAL